MAKDSWTGSAGFILANLSAAVGLGSIWKFPYEVGANGGGSFVLLYLAGLLIVVLPLMLAELVIGRRGQSDAITSIAVVAREAGASRSWGAIGAVGAITGILILSFYSVIGGWAIAYAVDGIRHGAGAADADAAQARFAALVAAPLKVTAYHAVFMAIVAAIVAKGVSTGIEAASRFLMPVLIALLAVLALYAAFTGDLRTALAFLFAPDTTHLTPRVALEALGLGFFSIGVGLATMITYAAYADRSIRLGKVAIATLVGDTAISFLAGLAIFPLVFAEQMSPASGAGLMFETLPVAFARLPFGGFAGILFFALVVVAAVGSGVALLELAVAIVRNALGWGRAGAAFACGFVAWVLGLTTVLSFSAWAEWFPLASVPLFARSTLYDLVDHLTSNLLLPVAGLAIAILCGWVLPRRLLSEELGWGRWPTIVLRALLRYAAPAGIVLATLTPHISR